ncbi:hypothetical protein LTR78_006018 [Recurvomyces mirabilis]|uniref:Uncharacterized protein n=1 Tax=Recurvomyces mirabilis TaxID=574656 RepID=A0AAE1C0U8_9PEZI|nr:hypothetical protein LTR78_006018 [Recurvomyces mirabilis]KAK5155172.1 hypothetical protein LTS14_006127 [Recurvomyces mirabilis]
MPESTRQESKGPCLEYGCSKFASFQDPELNGISADLRNQIHPIFHLNKFADNMDCDVLETPLRLATRLLLSDKLVPFINTITGGVIVALDGPLAGQLIDSIEKVCAYRENEFGGVDIGSNACAFYPKAADCNPGITDTQRQAAHHAIDRLEPLIDYLAAGKQLSVSAARVLTSSGPLTKTMTSHWPDGQIMKIAIGACYDQLSSKHYAYFETEDLYRTSAMAEALLMERIMFAIVLLHEIGHAFGNAAGGGRGRAEPFYKGSFISELGKELEGELFGGSVTNSNYVHQQEMCVHQTESSSRRRCFTVMDWPGAYYINTYTKQGQLNYYPRPWRFDTMWRIPMAWMEKLFTTEFWDNEVASHGVAALELPSTMGWTFADDQHLGGNERDSPLRAVRNGDPLLPKLVRREARRAHIHPEADHYAPL